MPQYRALTDLYLPDSRYIEAGTIISMPSTWPPPINAVDPLDTDAIQQVWNVGPIGLNGAQSSLNTGPYNPGGHFAPVGPNTHPWYPAEAWTRDYPVYLLKGGESLGQRSALDPSIVTTVGGYVGPGDLGIPFTAFWSVRGFSAGTLGSNAIQLRRVLDNVTGNFATVAGTALTDPAAITSFAGTSALKIAQWYDQTGHGNNLPLYASPVSPIVEIPFTANILKGSGASDNTSGIVNSFYGKDQVTDTTTWSHCFYAIYKVTGIQTFQSLVTILNDEVGLIAEANGFPPPLNTTSVKNEGTVRPDNQAVANSALGSWHAAVGVVNNTTAHNSGIQSSFVNVDNVSVVTHDLAGTIPATGNAITILGDDGTLPTRSNPLVGYAVELGWYAVAPPSPPWTQAQATALIANAKAFWGI